MLQVDTNENKVSMILQSIACDMYYNYVSTGIYNIVNNGIPSNLSDIFSDIAKGYE